MSVLMHKPLSLKKLKDLMPLKAEDRRNLKVKNQPAFILNALEITCLTVPKSCIWKTILKHILLQNDARISEEEFDTMNSV